MKIAICKHMTSLAAATLFLSLCLLSFVLESSGFKYHDFCQSPPLDLKTRFPLYTLDINTKTQGLPWAYRQNNTITVTVKALYRKFKIKQIFMSVPSMTKGSPEVPAKRIHQGRWKWDMKGGVIPLDCDKAAGGFGGAANAVRDLWWYPDGFFNVSAEWDPVNTFYNALNMDMVQFVVYVSPDAKDNSPPNTFGPLPQNRWVKLTSQKVLNLDYVDFHLFLQKNPHMRWMITSFGA